jgi:integrase
MNSISESKEGEVENPSPPSIDIDEFDRYLRGLGHADGTLLNYKRWVLSCGKIIGKDPADWTVKECTNLILSDRWLGTIDKPGYSKSSRILIKCSLKKYWLLKARYDLLGPENASFWQTQKIGGTSRREYIKTHTARPEQVERIINGCREIILMSKNPFEVNRAFMVFLLTAYGIRCVGLSYLRLKDFDLEGEVLTISRTKFGKNRTIWLDVPIDDLLPRYLVMRDKIINQLSKRHRDNPILRHRIEELKLPHARLFFTRNHTANRQPVGSRLTSENIQRTVRLMTKKMLEDGKGVNPHSLRHAKVYGLLERGWKIEKVASYMGHESIQTTYEYVVLGPEEQKAEEIRISGSTGSSCHVSESGEASTKAIRDELFDRYRNGEISLEEWIQARKLIDRCPEISNS